MILDFFFYRGGAEAQRNITAIKHSGGEKEIKSKDAGMQGFSASPRLRGKIKISGLLLLLLFAGIVEGQDNYRKVKNTTFQPGEFLKYRVFYDSWMTYWMTSGFGTTEVGGQMADIKGKQAYHIEINGYSTGIFNLFFKVRDRFESYVDKETLLPYKFIRYTREGGYKKDDVVEFNREERKAYSTRKVKDITPNVHDIVSAFYYMRNLDFDSAEVNDKYYLDFFIGREIVKTDFGKINCLRFKPRVATGEVFADPYPMEMYVTDDKNKIPVLMKSAVFIGSVKIELIEYRGLLYPFGEK
jgi:hypothetical protein